jgi:hypothetical protein
MPDCDIRDIFGDVMRRVQFGENCEPWIDVPEPIQAQWLNYADRIMRSLADAGIELSTREPAKRGLATTFPDQR